MCNRGNNIALALIVSDLLPLFLILATTVTCFLVPSVISVRMFVCLRQPLFDLHFDLQ
jgi:hypothetical protein